MLVVRSGALMAVLAILASQNSVRAQDADAKKKAEIQAKCAATPDKNSPLHRVRIDGFAVAGKTIAVEGVFLHGGNKVTKEEMDAGLDTIAVEKNALDKFLAPIVEETFGKGSVAATNKLMFIAPKELPHIKLQTEAFTQKHDEVLLEPVTFDKDGKAVLKALVSSVAEKEWLGKEWKLASEKKLKAGSDKSLGTSSAQIEVIPWKLSKSALQKALAASPRNQNRVKVDRVWFDWHLDGDLVKKQIVVVGVNLESKDYPILQADVDSTVARLWPELASWSPESRAVTVQSEIPEKDLRDALRAAIADIEPLDGVRIDPGLAFDGEGRLLLAGIIPKQEGAFSTALAAAVRKISKDLGPVKDRPGLLYSQSSESGVSTSKMSFVPIALLLSEVRRWAVDESEYDDVLLRRLYFDKGGKLTLKGKYARSEAKADVREKVIEQFKRRVEAGSAFAGKGISFDEKPSEETFTPFAAGFTTFLRAMVEADQKKWAGVLLEHGYFTDRGAYGIRGLADRDDQPELLAQVIKDESKNPRWEGYFDASPNPIDIKVMPLAPMLARLKRVAPGYEAFDHLEFTGVVQHTKDGLVFSADAFTNSGSDLAVRTADWLLKKHPDWKRRAKPGVKIKSTVQADTSDESRWLNPFYTAEALAKNKMPQAKLSLASTTRHFPGSSGTWYLSALYNSCLGDRELVRRDLYRVIQLEGQLVPSRNSYRNDSRTSRYDLAEKVHGPERAVVETLEPWLRREMRDGRPQIQLVPDPEVLLPK